MVKRVYRSSSARLRAARTARLSAPSDRHSAISTDNAAAVVPPGLVTASRNAEATTCPPPAGRRPPPRWRGQIFGLGARQAFRHTGFGQGFRHQEQIGGPGTRNRRDTVDQFFLPHPFGVAQRRSSDAARFLSAAVTPLAA